MFNATRVVLEGIIEDGAYSSQRADADATFTHLKSFEFVCILHLVKEIMGRTDILSQNLQKKSQDIVNAIELVSTTKKSLNRFRNKGWDDFIQEVILFSKNHQIDMPDMKASYKSGRYRPRKHDNHVTFEHYYRVDLFFAALDKQLYELDNRFNDHVTGLLTLGSLLVPKKDFKESNINEICNLVQKYYPADFTEQERIRLKYELGLFSIYMLENPKLKGVSDIVEVCKNIMATGKVEEYHLVDRLIRLILKLPVSTTTTKRGFSAMKVCKNRLRNKMSDEFLADSLVVYIEKEIAEKFDPGSVIEEFKSLKGRKAEL